MMRFAQLSVSYLIPWLFNLYVIVLLKIYTLCRFSYPLNCDAHWRFYIFICWCSFLFDHLSVTLYLDIDPSGESFECMLLQTDLPVFSPIPNEFNVHAALERRRRTWRPVAIWPYTCVYFAFYHWQWRGFILFLLKTFSTVRDCDTVVRSIQWLFHAGNYNENNVPL